MAFAIKFAIDGYHALIQGLRNIVMSRIEVRVRQLGKAGSKVRGDAARFRLQTYRFFKNGKRLIIFATIFQDFSESKGSASHGWMARREMTLAHFQAIAREPFGFLVLGLIGP